MEEPGRLQSMGSRRVRATLLSLSDFTFTFHFYALEKEMATHSRVLAWRIPGTGEPDGLPSMGSHRVRHDWSDLAAAAAAAADLSHNQLQVLFLLTVLSFFIFGCKVYNQSDFYIDHLVTSICRTISCVAGRGCLLWSMHSLGKALLVFAPTSFCTPRQNLPVIPDISWLPTFAFQSPIMKRRSFGVVLECLIGSHRTI